MQKDVVDIEASRAKLWDAMTKLAAASRFATQLDQRLDEKVKSLEATDPQKAQALRQEVLFYARQNLTDIQTQQAVCVNGYLALDVLKKTGREMINGCTRVATTGMSALAVAQTVARATGNQIRVMEMLQGVNATIGNLISETGRALNQHVDATTQFASNPHTMRRSLLPNSSRQLYGKARRCPRGYNRNRRLPRPWPQYRLRDSPYTRLRYRPAFVLAWSPRPPE